MAEEEVHVRNGHLLDALLLVFATGAPCAITKPTVVSELAAVGDRTVQTE